MTSFYRISVTVPPTHVDAVRLAMGAAGAGQIGAYADCAVTWPVTGYFRPLEGAHPVLGQNDGTIQQVAEYRLEMRVAAARLEAVMAALRAAHPYEEIAVDVIPLIA